tara:strand:- start:519 stop:1631 length:1113 start_codon:yes stop_codon:yes gene_type:complete
MLAKNRIAGIYSDIQIQKLIDQKNITSEKNISIDQIQPASLDLSLGNKAWRVKSSFLPGIKNKVSDKVPRLSMHEIDLNNGAVLEKGCVYIAEIEESLNLPKSISASANPKSSTGRLDIFTRLIVDNVGEFEYVPNGYKGPLYIEISPRTFSVLVYSGSRLNQLRFRSGNFLLSDEEVKSLHKGESLISGYEGKIDIRDGVPLSIDLTGGSDGLIGYRARKHSDLIDIEKIGYYDKELFWEMVTSRDLSSNGLVLNPDEFYILASREFVTIPEKYAAEMRAYDTRVGEFRAHYAGFFDPGFGLAALGAKPTRAVLEVRSHDVPFLIEEGQTVCRLVYEKMSTVPRKIYGGKGMSSNYQSQGLKLSKHFIA